jgi:hypothetical protein
MDLSTPPRVNVSDMSLDEQCALVQQVLAANRVVTVEQLMRWQLLEAASALQLPCVERTVRTQVTQEMVRTLQFVSSHVSWLERSDRELKHWAALGEVWWTWSPTTYGAGRWTVLDGRGRMGRRMPDARVRKVMLEPCAVEIDCGYSTAQIERKLLGFGAAGYRRLVWATTVHGRVRRVATLIDALWRAGDLEDLLMYHVQYCNFWSSTDPYNNRPRCHKPNGIRNESPLYLPWLDAGFDADDAYDEDEQYEDDWHEDDRYDEDEDDGEDEEDLRLGT